VTLAPDAVRTMFDRIAPVYDAMNRVMTAGLDMRWRRIAATAVVRPGDRVLDAACGTGDFAVADARAGAGHVIGLDFSERMLARARNKAPWVEWVRGDMLALPFPDSSFDAATVGFGVRNTDLEGALGELRRVLRRGGRLAVLETTQPVGLLRPFYSLWFDRLVPMVGRLLPGGEAYAYLPASAKRFPPAEELAERMRRAGFEDVHVRRLGGSIVALHTGVAA